MFINVFGVLKGFDNFLTIHFTYDFKLIFKCLHFMFIYVHPSTFFLRLDLYDIDKILSSMSPFITLTIFNFLPLFVLYYINLMLRLRVNIRGVSVRIEKYTDHTPLNVNLLSNV